MNAYKVYDYINRQINKSKRKINNIIKIMQVSICIILLLCVLPKSIEIKTISLFADTIILLFYFKIISKVSSHEINRISERFENLPLKEKECISKYVSRKVYE